MTDVAVADLTEERDYLLKALADLETERSAGAIDDDDYSALRDGYTARAAAAIRAIEAAQHRGSNAVDHAKPVRSVHARRRRRAVAVLGALGVIALAVAVAATVSSARLPGQTTSGSATLAPAQQVVQELAQGRILAAKNDNLGAIKEFSKVLAIDSNQPEALAYRGWLIRLAGVAGHDAALASQGRASVEAAIAADPTYPDAHAFMGYILFQDAHDAVGAAGQFRLFLADKPPAAMVSLTQRVVAAAFVAVGQPVPVATDPQG